MPETKLFEIIDCMAALIRAQQRQNCAKLRLQLVHYDVLNYLSSCNHYIDTPAAIAAHFGMTRGTISQSIILLEKKSYLEKNKDSEDKRMIHIQLQPLGLNLLQKADNSAWFNQATALLDVESKLTSKKTIFQETHAALLKAAGKKSTLSFRVRKNMTAFHFIDEIAALIRAEERKLCTLNKLQLVHFEVLKYLSFCNRYSDTPAAVTRFLGMTRGTVSQTLIVLQKRELLEKIQDSKDKRIIHLRLLPKGQQLLEKVNPIELYTQVEAILAGKAVTQNSATLLLDALNALQKTNPGKHSFGNCHTCRHFLSQKNTTRCGLTDDPLSTNDINKLCQEHTPR
jgi:MarR family transcriptional regulator, negative regulator of the multidrug operon emrRAB